MLFVFGFIWLIAALALAKAARWLSALDVVVILLGLPISAALAYFVVPLLGL